MLTVAVLCNTNWPYIFLQLAVRLPVQLVTNGCAFCHTNCCFKALPAVCYKFGLYNMMKQS